MAKRRTDIERVMNPHSRPVDVGGGRVLAPGQHADVDVSDPRAARLVERGTLRRARTRPAASPSASDQQSDVDVSAQPAGDQEVDQ